MEEEKKVLAEEEEKQVAGGTSAAFPNQKMSVFCPICKSLDVKAKTFTVDKDGKYKVVYQCNSCGNVWEAYPTPVFPGYGQNSN